MMQPKFGAGWRQVGASLVVMSACAMVTGVYGIIAVPLAREFEPSRMVLMLAVTTIMLVAAGISPIVGAIMDRISLRLVMMTGVLLVGVGYAALSLVTAFWQVLLVYGLLMAPASVLCGTMAMMVLLSRWFVRRRGAAVGVAASGLSHRGLHSDGASSDPGTFGRSAKRHRQPARSSPILRSGC